MKNIDYSAMYTGTNYHPHDWPEDRWEFDICLMAKSGFNVVRLGHLCWDSFEPNDGVFTFEWMDRVMDLCQKYNIGVFLDIPTRPAPVWLHKKYPSIDIVSKSGARQNPHSRYMEDVGDPYFKKYALRLAEKITSRYYNHPALLAFGLCNELGAGFASFSESARIRFTKWLENKYQTIDNLNCAWASHRWSRRVNSFDEVDLPIGEEKLGAPERYLDMRRFYSDEIINYIKEFKAVVNNAAPGVPVSTNHWSETNPGFDYNKNCESLFDFPAQGFYPGVNPEDSNGYLGAVFVNAHRFSEFDKPIWNVEFQTGGNGDYGCPPNAMRMYAYLLYIMGSQATVAWTWRSMLGGEEQYLFGLLDHDGEPGRKLYEFERIAKEAALLNKKGVFPVKLNPEVAVAYSYEDEIITNYSKNYYTISHLSQATAAVKSVFSLMRDVAVVNPSSIKKQYKVLILPGCAQMTPEIVSTIKRQLQGGATVIMTAFSAKVNENNQVFDTSLPGLLTDVFGIKIHGFDRAVTHVPDVNVGGLEKEDIKTRRTYVTIEDAQGVWASDVNYHEFIEPVTAQTLASYKGSFGDNLSAITVNSYGNGKAVYLGIPADEQIIKTLLNRLCGITPAFNDLSAGVVARKINNKTIYINTTGFEKTINACGKSVFTDALLNKVILKPYEVEIIE